MCLSLAATQAVGLALLADSLELLVSVHSRTSHTRTRSSGDDTDTMFLWGVFASQYWRSSKPLHWLPVRMWSLS